LRQFFCPAGKRFVAIIELSLMSLENKYKKSHSDESDTLTSHKTNKKWLPSQNSIIYDQKTIGQAKKLA